MNELPWADPEFSSRLPELRAQGEGTSLEYMASFPSSVRELGKEIAALATSGGGLILLGVADDGDLAGLGDMTSSEARDSVLRRLEGICHGMVKPSVTPHVTFGAENGEAVLGIDVPRGSEPVYYCNNVPYLRHLTEARPAEPHEVVELVRAWFSDHPDSDPVYRAIASSWAALTLFSQDLRGWQLADNFSQLKAQLHTTADWLQTAAATDEAAESRLAAPLKHVADLLEQAIAVPRFIGPTSGQQAATLITQALTEIADLYHAYASTRQLSTSERRDVNRLCREHSRRIQDLMQRLPDTIDNDRFVRLLQNLALEGHHIFHILALHGLASMDGGLTPHARAAAQLFALPAKYPFYTDRPMRLGILLPPWSF